MSCNKEYSFEIKTKKWLDMVFDDADKIQKQRAEKYEIFDRKMFFSVTSRLFSQISASSRILPFRCNSMSPKLFRRFRSWNRSNIARQALQLRGFRQIRICFFFGNRVRGAHFRDICELKRARAWISTAAPICRINFSWQTADEKFLQFRRVTTPIS